MSTSAPEMLRPHNLTPSEIVVLRCDDFAPVPPLTLGARIHFEFDSAFGFLMGMFFATAVLVSANQFGHPAAARVIGALADLALPAIWWYFRRRKDPFLDREEIGAVRPLGGTRAAVHPQLVQLAISAALLANEQAGALHLENEGGRLIARFNGSDPHWPPDSLEDRLRRARPIRVSELVYDWMADGSNFPLTRALRLIEHSAVLRGLACTQQNLADTAEPAPVKALLEECRLQRPAIWKALQAGIGAGVKSRTVEPRWEQIGQMSVPKYDYNEAPISALDTPARDTSQGSANGSAPKYMRIGTTLLVTALFIGATVFTVMEYHQDKWGAAVLTATGMFVGLQTCELLAKRAKQHRKRLRQEYGLPPEPDLDEGSLEANLPLSRLQQRLASSAMLAAIAALPVAIWGAWTAIFPLLLIGIFLFGSTWRLPKELAAEVVAARVKALAAADALAEDPAAPNTGEPVSASARDSIDFPQPTLSRAACPLLPGQPTAAHDLPPASPEIAELLDRWTRRRARFRRLHWISLGVLIGGYTLMELAFWFTGSTPWIKVSDIADNIPFGLLFMLVATGIGFVYWRGSGAVEDGSGNSRHSGLALVIAVWRIFILVQAPLLFTVAINRGRDEALKRHPIFVASVLLFLLLHWMCMEWAMARAMRDCPVPSPRRLVMLRVFGSPAFDDLVTLIGPWQTVGLIEHLEGFDTVGTRSDVQAAVDSGKVDRILAKDLAEVRDQLARESTGPDRALRFRRHAFQCTNATWRQAILAMLDRADAVLMDLSSLSVERQGCAWELCQLLYRVPLANVTLLVNDSTDLECLRSILNNAAEHMPPDSPNRSNPAVAWQLIRIGGLQARQPSESFYEWTRRIDIRLDPRLLTSWLLSTARPPGTKEAAKDAFRFSAGISWARQARWSWLVLLALSTALAFEQWFR